MQLRSRKVLPSYQEVRRIQKAFYDAAEEKRLPCRRRALYRSWILGFLYWCYARPPHRASPDRIRPFLRAIQSHPQSEPVHEAQATEALNFLFDAVQPRLGEGLSLFTTGISRPEDTAPSPRGTSSLGIQGPEQADENQEGSSRERNSPDGGSSEGNTWGGPVTGSDGDSAQPKGDPFQSKTPPRSPKEGSPEEGVPEEGEPEGESGALHLSLSKEHAERLWQVAGHLELPPELVAERAIELVCSEAGTPQEAPPSKERSLSTGTLLYQNQARIDLLSSRKNSDENNTREASDTETTSGTSSSSQNDRAENGTTEDSASEGEKGDIQPRPDAVLIK